MVIPVFLKSPGRLYQLGAILFFLGAGGLFYGPYLSRMPAGIHAWAQSDRLSLALNFYDYGFQFLTPRTSSLFSIGGVTGVEFPIQAYVAALGGLLFGRGAINEIFRLLDVLITVVGMFYLFRIVFERTQHFVAALVPGCFLLSSATFAYYAGNYLPDPASLSLSFVGYYYWLRYFDRLVFRDLLVAIAWLTLASLMKTTTALYLGAALGLTILWTYFRPDLLTLRQKCWFIGISTLAVGSILFFFYHNQSLNKYYQSWLFLAETKPIKDADMLHTTLRFVKQFWWNSYATKTQYRIIAACGALFLLFLWPNLRKRLPIVLFIVLSIGIGYAFFWAMGEQLSVHDYYVICSFGPIVMGLLLAALLNIGAYGSWYKWASTLGLAVLCFVLLRDGYKGLEQRMIENNFAWALDGGARLSQYGVGAGATVLVLTDPSPNTTLVYLDRRGITRNTANEMPSADQLASSMATDSLEYLIIPKPYYDTMTPQHEALKASFVLVMEEPFVVMRRLDMRRPW